MVDREGYALRDELLQKNAELRKELYRQWKFNHAGHCQIGWPHGGVCHWPLPGFFGVKLRKEITLAHVAELVKSAGSHSPFPED